MPDGPFNSPIELDNAADANINDVPFITDNKGPGAQNPGQNGVFAQNPLMSPKYSKFRPRDAEYRDTLARIYISVSDLSDSDRSKYLATLPSDQATQSLAKVLLGANSKGGTGFIDFFLTTASEPFQEIMQVDKVLSDDYVAFFFGQQPPVFQYSGMLLNSMQDDQRSGFGKAYNLMLRGTQLARRGALARLRYDSVIVSGVMTAHQQQLNSDNELAVPFSFSFLVKEYVILDNLPFAKITTDDYVKLAADSAIAALQPAATPTQGTKTTMVTTPVPSAVSTAGAPPNTSVVDTGASTMKQMIAQAAIAAALQTAAALTNIRGTIDPNPPLPTPPSVP